MENKKIKIHKRYQRNIILGETMRCGITGFNIFPNCSFKWKNVTCKNCLKFKPKERKNQQTLFSSKIKNRLNNST